METKTFFFNESTTENKINELLIDSTKEVQTYVKTITNRKGRNKIGYFQFLSNNIYYKFYIMPKIYIVEEGEYDNCDLQKKQFIEFFKHYYRLITKYDIQKYNDELGGNISDLGIKSDREKSSFSYKEVNDIDDFVVHNYVNSLKVLEVFFIKHKRQILVEQEFKSQSIKNKLHIKKNLLSFDKSFVHQIKKTPMIYSNIALITIVVLKDFLYKKLRNFSNTKQSLLLKKEVNQLSNLLKKRFPNNKQIFNIKDLLSKKHLNYLKRIMNIN